MRQIHPVIDVRFSILLTDDNNKDSLHNWKFYYRWKQQRGPWTGRRYIRWWRWVVWYCCWYLFDSPLHNYESQWKVVVLKLDWSRPWSTAHSTSSRREIIWTPRYISLQNVIGIKDAGGVGAKLNSYNIDLTKERKIPKLHLSIFAISNSFSLSYSRKKHNCIYNECFIYPHKLIEFLM